MIDEVQAEGQKRVFYLEFSVPKLSLCCDCQPSDDTDNFSLSIPGSKYKVILNSYNAHVDDVIPPRLSKIIDYYYCC